MGTHPIFESDFDCLTDRNMNRLVLARTYISHRPSWADNTPVAPHEWGTKISRVFTRLPEIGWLMIGFVFCWMLFYQRHWVAQNEPEFTFIVEDNYLDNPMFSSHRFVGHTGLEKAESDLYANKNMTVENKVDRYMQHSTSDWVRLGSSGYCSPGWTSPLDGKYYPSSSKGLIAPFDTPNRPNTENAFVTSIIDHKV